jgi:hypothetical protein
LKFIVKKGENHEREKQPDKNESSSREGEKASTKAMASKG